MIDILSRIKEETFLVEASIEVRSTDKMVGETDFVPGDSVPRYFVPRFCAWRFCAQDILCLVDFVPIFDFVPGRFCAQDILCPGFLFCAQKSNFLRRLVPNETSCAWDILCLGRFCAH